MILGHTLDPTPEQAAHFRPACGTARFACNWGVVEWQRMREAGEKPSTAAVKCRCSAPRKAELPWTYEVTRCASGQAIMAPGTASANFLHDCKKPRQQRRFRYPRFKNKARNESFALWTDQFAMSGKQVRIAKPGFVRMREELRFVGKIIGAIVLTQICSCCGCLTGPKGEEMHVEEWICSECGAGHTRDGNAAINLRKLGTAGAYSTGGDMTPLPAVLRMSASVAGEPRTEIERTCAHI
jgi:transposase